MILSLARATWAIARLVAARARRRRSAGALVALSVAGSIVVLGSLLGVGIVTEDLATRRALADLAPQDRLIGIQRTTDDGFADAQTDSLARAAFRPVLDITKPVVAVRMYRPPRDPFRIVALDGLADWLDVGEGRLPGPCTGDGPCEAVRVGPSLPSGVGAIGTSVDLSGLRFDIVGSAAASPDLPVPVIQSSGLVLMVEGFGIHESDDVRLVPRTTFWLAPIDPGVVHSWTLSNLDGRVGQIQEALGADRRSFLLTTPEQTLAAVHTRTQVAIGRLVFISSLIVGVLLAFAAFAAAMERADVALEDRRLRAAGAAGWTRFMFVVGEALLPGLVGAVVGELGAMAAVSLLARGADSPIDVVLQLALLQPMAIAATALLVCLAMVAVILGVHPAAGRLLQRQVVIAAVVPVGLILGWQRLTAGPVNPTTLASEATSPALVVLPGGLGLAVILGSLALLPPFLRGLARLMRRSPIAIRLATISLAREPLRPAAIMTLLAFSVGAVVFAQVYSATLRRSAADQAAFQVGMDVRVQTLAAEGRFTSEVVPALQAGALGSDVEVQPMVRAIGETVSGRTFTLVGIDHALIGRLPGWRRDFSPDSPTALGSAIDLGGQWKLAAQPLPPGVRDISIDVEYTGDPIRLSAIVEETTGVVRYVSLGELGTGHQTMSGALFDRTELPDLSDSEPTGWQLVGLLASNGGDAAEGGPKVGQHQEGDLTVRGLENLLDPDIPTHLVVSSLAPQLIRPAARTDGLALPAIVSPDLVGDIGAAGISVGSSLYLQLRAVAVTTSFPTILEPGGRVVVVDLAPLLLAMNAHDPGTGRSNQVLLGTPNDTRTGEVVAALESGQYPPLIIQSRPKAEERRANDPFAIGIVWGLAVGAIAGLVLSVTGVLLAVATELRDERGELWELEAQGSRPKSLVRLVLLRTATMCGLGCGAGIALGVLLGWFVASAIGVGGEGAAPFPPLVLQTPWGQIIGIAVLLLGLITAAVWLQARRHFRDGALGSGVR